MGLFRPDRTVTGPTGDYWELYVSKTAMPSWREGDDGDASFYGSFGLVGIPLAIVGAIWSILVQPLLRMLVVLPFAFVRGRRSRAIRIEALNPYPVRQVLLWTTTDGQVDRVLEEIATGLAAGKVVQPVGAVYSGVQSG